MKVYVYVYNELLFFPLSDIDYETIKTKKLFLHTHQLIKGKAHLHHSHITGEIIGYSHHFCNTRVTVKNDATFLLLHITFLVSIYIIFLRLLLLLRGALKKLMLVETS